MDRFEGRTVDSDSVSTAWASGREATSAVEANEGVKETGTDLQRAPIPLKPEGATIGRTEDELQKVEYAFADCPDRGRSPDPGRDHSPAVSTGNTGNARVNLRF